MPRPLYAVLRRRVSSLALSLSSRVIEMLPGVADLLLFLRLRISIVCGVLGSNCVRAVLLMLGRTLLVESASAAVLLAVCSGTR